jgi:Ca2+-binding RTX toxin-like protein
LGRAGDDQLFGNGGDDRIRGGLGADTMGGGDGADTFIYAPLPNALDNPYTVAALESTSLNYDTIFGFNYAEDRIDLPQTVTSLASVASGILNGGTFDADLAAAVDGALAANGAVLFAATDGQYAGQTFLVVDGDNNGSYQANLDYVINLASPIGTPPTGTEIFV